MNEKLVFTLHKNKRSEIADGCRQESTRTVLTSGIDSSHGIATDNLLLCFLVIIA